jgi:hypothetical protein
VGYTTGRELHPAPKVEYLIEWIILQIKQPGTDLKIFQPLNVQGRMTPPLAVTFSLCLEDGYIRHRADSLALRGIKVANAFHAGGGINQVGTTFGDRVGRAFRDTGSTGNALICNF